MTIHNSQRTMARRLALQAIYQVDVQGEDFLTQGMDLFLSQQSEDAQVQAAAGEYTKGTWAYRQEADQWLAVLVPRWSVARMAVVDRSILRLAAWELTHADTPPPVILDEAITMARDFSTGDSAEFINGVLDAVIKDYARQTGKASPAGPAV